MLHGVGRVGLVSSSRTGGLFVGPNYLSPAFTLTREQASGARSTALGADGVTWNEFDADVPRFNGTARRLLVGGQRLNILSNPRAEGAVAGVPGTVPTSWAITNPSLRSIAGVVSDLGLSRLDIDFTFGSSGSVEVQAGTATVTAGSLTAGQTYTFSGFLRLVSGSLSNLSISLRVEFRNSSFTIINSVSQSIVPTGNLIRTSVTGVAGAAVDRATIYWRIDASSAATCRLGFAAPCFELGAFASTPILPATGTPAASTRGADLVSATLANLNLGINGAGTVIGVGMLPQLAPASSDQTLLTIGTTNSNSYRIRNLAGGSTITAGRTTGGFDSDTASLGTIVAGTPFAFGITIDGAGRMAACINGGNVFSVTGGPTSSLTTFRLGNNITDATPMFGEIATLRTLTKVISDSELQRRVATLALS